MSKPFELVKQAETKLDKVFELEPVQESPTFDSVALDSDHQQLLGWLTGNSLAEWDSKAKRLHAHTFSLKQAHEVLNLKGEFETLSTGSTERNCFAYPKADGAWFVCRHGKGVNEHPSWRTSANGWTVCDFNKKVVAAKEDPAAAIVRLARDCDEFFHSPDGQAYVTTKRFGRSETLLVKERSYQHILRMRFTLDSSKVAKPEWLRTAQDQLEACAMEEGPEYPVYVRVGWHCENVYLDLADAERRVVEITRDGWKLVQNPPVRFRRPPSMLPLPVPQTGGTADVLRPFFNVRDEDWAALLGAMVMCFHPQGPFPCVLLQGRAGSAKSSVAKSIQRLIDPTAVEGAPLPKTVEDLMIRGSEGYLLWFDNISVIDQEMSDGLCRLSGGAALARRKKYSDADETVFRAKRPVILTAINEVIRATDLLDRSLCCNLPSLRQRKAERKFNADFEAVRAQGLGLLLNGLATALRDSETVTIQAPTRLVDFCCWATAAEEGLGLSLGSFMTSYRTNLAEARGLFLEDEFAKDILKISREIKDGKVGFEGTAKELGELLEWKDLDSTSLRSRMSHLRQLCPLLEEEGVSVEFLPKLNSRRLVRIQSR